MPMLSMTRFAAAGSVLLAGLTAAAQEVRIQGAGATFPNPLYQRWVADYQKAHPTVKIDYQSIGSGGGIKAITEKTVDFAGSDAPLNKKEIEAMGGADAVVEVPSCAGAVVPAYNLPGVGELKFTGEALAGIFAGTITKWNDAKIAAANEGVTLPDMAIVPAWRTDGSGTTYVFTSYLATQSESFKSTVGAGKQVKWPAGQGGKGNEGVAAVVQQTRGAIGYIEQNYATANKIPFGAVKNKAGTFVKASEASVAAAGEAAAAGMKGTVLAANIWNQPGEQAYPISAFTYLIVYKDLSALKKEQATALGDFLWWASHEGQQSTPGSLGFAPLAPAVQQKVAEALGTLTYQGRPVVSTGR
jgi:phosphate transport system substrate-binding protein